MLLTAVNRGSPSFGVAQQFLASHEESADCAVSELVLAELYVLLRNPHAVTSPLSASAAVSVCQGFRRHPRWRLLGFPSASAELHDELWRRAAQSQFARLRIYDLRLALALIQQGVTEFATMNAKDFHGFGFERVWNPLAATARG